MADNCPIYHIINHPDSPSLHLQSKTTPSLTLHLPTPLDIPAILSILSNKANSAFDKSISNATAQELHSIAERWTTLNNPLTHLNFLIRHNQHEEPLGIAGLGWIGPANKDGENMEERAGAAGVMLQPFARGKGYAYEALRVVFDYGLWELGLVEVRIGSHGGNGTMRGLMEGKFGFRRVVKREEEVDEFGNDLLWVVRKEEWLRSNT